MKPKSAKKGRPTIQTSKSSRCIAALQFFGSLGNRADDPRWLDAVNFARMLRQVGDAYSDQRSDTGKLALRVSFGPIRHVLEMLARETRNSRAPEFLEDAALAIRAGLDDPSAVVSWRAHLVFAWGEAFVTAKHKPPHLAAVQARLKKWGHAVDQKTIGNALRDLPTPLPVSRQGVYHH